MDIFNRFDRQERQYLILFMTGIATPVRLAIAEEDVAPFRKCLFAPRQETATPSPFYWLSSFDGKEVLISLPDVEYVNFLFQVERPLISLAKSTSNDLDERSKADRYDGTIDFYFRGRPEPVSIQANDSPQLKQIFDDLVGGRTRQSSSFAYINDLEGGLVAFRSDRVTLIVAHRGSIQMTSDTDYEKLFRPAD